MNYFKINFVIVKSVIRIFGISTRLIKYQLSAVMLLVSAVSCHVANIRCQLSDIYLRSGFSCLSDNCIFSPGLNAGIPKYGQEAHLK